MKILEGIVVSTKMQNTVVVEVTRRTPHPLYKKLMKKSRKFKADANGITVHEGDRVRIVETKPVSKDKHFKIHERVTTKKEAKE